MHIGFQSVCVCGCPDFTFSKSSQAMTVPLVQGKEACRCLCIHLLHRPLPSACSALGTVLDIEDTTVNGTGWFCHSSDQKSINICWTCPSLRWKATDTLFIKIVRLSPIICTLNFSIFFWLSCFQNAFFWYVYGFLFSLQQCMCLCVYQLGWSMRQFNLDKSTLSKYHHVVLYLVLEFEVTVTSSFRLLSTSWSQS